MRSVRNNANLLSESLAFKIRYYSKTFLIFFYDTI